MVQIIGSSCPHCGSQLERLELPDGVFDHAYDLVCFDDDCPYYVRGWAWMEQQYGVKASYRFRVDGSRGNPSPLAVWSPTAFKSRLAGPGAGGREDHP